MISSREAGDAQVEAAEQRAGQDLEALRRRQGRNARRRGVRPGHAPHEHQARRPRPPRRAAHAPHAALETGILISEASEFRKGVRARFPSLTERGDWEFFLRSSLALVTQIWENCFVSFSFF